MANDLSKLVSLNIYAVLANVWVASFLKNNNKSFFRCNRTHFFYCQKHQLIWFIMSEHEKPSSCLAIGAAAVREEITKLSVRSKAEFFTKNVITVLALGVLHTFMYIKNTAKAR